MITPFRDSQEQARDIIEDEADFVLVYVKCSLEEAKERDPKGLYEQAEAGKIEKFTGVNHPFQEPLNPEIVVDTEEQTEDEAVEHVLAQLEALGVLDERLDEEYGFSISRSEEQEVADRLEDLGQL
jgi:adenylylsulfate kinase